MATIVGIAVTVVIDGVTPIAAIVGFDIQWIVGCGLGVSVGDGSMVGVAVAVLCDSGTEEGVRSRILVQVATMVKVGEGESVGISVSVSVGDDWTVAVGGVFSERVSTPGLSRVGLK